MTQTYWRVQDASTDPQRLLDSATWQSRVWSGVATVTCPDCKGYQTDEQCETCKDAGQVEDVRYGVSACRSMENLYSYFGRRMGPDTITAEQLEDCVLVEMEADVSEDDDHDADEGLSMLVWPRRIVSVRPFGPEDIPAEYIEEQR
ncbi:MAG TPA: hypothetical protein VFY84_14160 [Jiangellales bacterium]|nr:hypothetical protein [Jiangellales bacterium]